MSKVKEIAVEKPYFIVGDLSSSPQSKTYNILKKYFNDTYEVAEKNMVLITLIMLLNWIQL